MQQAIEDRRRDDRVAEDRAPFAVALVGGQDDGKRQRKPSVRVLGLVMK
jgi:hypothetical protein